MRDASFGGCSCSGVLMIAVIVGVVWGRALVHVSRRFGWVRGAERLPALSASRAGAAVRGSHQSCASQRASSKRRASSREANDVGTRPHNFSLTRDARHECNIKRCLRLRLRLRLRLQFQPFEPFKKDATLSSE